MESDTELLWWGLSNVADMALFTPVGSLNTSLRRNSSEMSILELAHVYLVSRESSRFDGRD